MKLNLLAGDNSNKTKALFRFWWSPVAQKLAKWRWMTLRWTSSR